MSLARAPRTRRRADGAGRSPGRRPSPGPHAAGTAHHRSFRPETFQPLPDRRPSQETGNLPPSLRRGMEAVSGLDLGDVRVEYNSPRPAGLGAAAYAAGSEIHLGPGAEKHLPHELGHVVQQRQGRVRPDGTERGVRVNTSPALEGDAHSLGRQALAGGGRGFRGPTAFPAGRAHPAVVQKYDPLPRNELEAWVRDHILKTDSDFHKSVKWLMEQRKRDAQQHKIDWEKEQTAGAWADKISQDDELWAMRRRFKVPDLKQSKYKIVRNEEVNLDESDSDSATEEEEEDDDAMDMAPPPDRGILVSAPLYAGVQDFPTRYLQGAAKTEDFAFILAYNSHGLTAESRPVENAVGRNELGNSRGVALGFYWDQKLRDKVNDKDVWTDDASFRRELNEKSSNAKQRAEFAASLRHDRKVLGTFPYGMWRNIAMNKTSVNAVLDSPWGQAHAPVMAHITDPDAETWVDPFSGKHAGEAMAAEANAGAQPAHVVKGSYVYAAGKQSDGDWDRHLSNIAHTSSMLDALLRPALADKVGVSYPAERNLMIRLKGVGQEAALYQQAGWQNRTDLSLNLNETNLFDGSGSAFGLGDAEGKELEKSVNAVVHGARSLVTKTAVTTDVPARVKATIAFENYSTHAESAETGSLKAASNVKESLLANETTSMMKRARGADSEARKVAYSEFRDRPRQTWKAISDAATRAAATPRRVVDALDRQVDSWRTTDQTEIAWPQLGQNVAETERRKTQLLGRLRELHGIYYRLANVSPPPLASREELIKARDDLGTELQTLEAYRLQAAVLAQTNLTRLRGLRLEPNRQADFVEPLKKRQETAHTYLHKHAADQIQILQEYRAKIGQRIG